MSSSTTRTTASTTTPATIVATGPVPPAGPPAPAGEGPTGPDRRDVRAGTAGLGAALLSVAIGVTQLLYPQDLDPQIDPRTRVMLVGMTLLLWSLVPLYLRLARATRRPWGGRVASLGTVGLSVGTLSSAINGIDFGWFPAVAVASNTLWFVGSVGLAVGLWRSRRLPRVLAVLLPAVVPVSLFGSQTGGGVPAGAVLAVVAWLVLRGQLDRR